MAIIDQETAQRDPQIHRLPTPEPQSSPLLSLSSQGSDKPRRKPTVTPRTFTRFFTPRSSLGGSRKIGASRKILRDITESGSNRKAGSRRRRQVDDRLQSLDESDDYDDEFPDISQKRKRYQPISPEPTPDLSSPLKRTRSQSLEGPEDEAINDESFETSNNSKDEHTEEQAQDHRQTSRPIISRRHGPSGMAFSRELGDIYRTRRFQYPLNGNIRLYPIVYLDC